MAINIKYRVTVLSESGTDKVVLSLTPATEEIENEDGTKTFIQVQPTNINLTLDNEDAKAFWPGQDVTITLK